MSHSITGDTVTSLTLDAAARGRACPGCGLRPHNISPIEAVAVLRNLQRRETSLLNNRELSMSQSVEPGSWSPMECALQMSEALSTATRCLRDLLAEESVEPFPAVETSAPASSPPAAWAPPAASAVVASIADNITSLAATIDGATAEDWYHVSPDGRVTAADIVWSAIHDATHHLEDVELSLWASRGHRTTASSATHGRGG